MSRSSLSLLVVGVGYPNKRGPTRAFEIALCTPGEPVELRPEPKNPADPYAVAVFSVRGVQLGYLTAERAPWIGAMIARGRQMRAVFQQGSNRSAVIRIAFDGEDVTLPLLSAQNPPSDDTDFWPDPEYPDE